MPGFNHTNFFRGNRIDSGATGDLVEESATKAGEALRNKGYSNVIACGICGDTTLIPGEGGFCLNGCVFNEKEHQTLGIQQRSRGSYGIDNYKGLKRRSNQNYSIDQLTGLYYDLDNVKIDDEKQSFFIPFKIKNPGGKKLAISGNFTCSESKQFRGNKPTSFETTYVNIDKKYEWKKNPHYKSGFGYTVIQNYRHNFNYKKLNQLAKTVIRLKRSTENLA